MELEFERLLWIREKGEPESCKPILVGIVDGKMHWHAGMTRCSWEPERFDIVREYPSDAIEQTEDDLDTEYAPKPQEPCARLGWVSPEGHFYPCAYCCHNYLENTLGRQLHDSPWAQLRKKGWIELKSGALIGVEYKSIPSQAAKDTVRKVVEAFELEESLNPDINWRACLEDNPEGYSKDNGWSDPTGDLIYAGTYAQALRSCYELHFGEGDANPEDMKLTTPPMFGDNIRVRRQGEHPGD